MSEQDIPVLRSALAAAIVQGSDTSEAMTDLLYANVPLDAKFEIINFTDLVRGNAQSATSLKRLIQAMSILEKYARHLMKPREQRSNMWRHIKYSNNIFRERVNAIQGGKYIMSQMGYTEERPDGVAFPDGVEPNPDHVLNLLTDLVQGRKELETYLERQHPRPGEIEQILAPQLRATLAGDMTASGNMSAGSQQSVHGSVPGSPFVQYQQNPNLPPGSMRSTQNLVPQQYPRQSSPNDLGARQKTTGSNMTQMGQYAEPNLLTRPEIKSPYLNHNQLTQRMPNYTKDTYMQNSGSEQGQGHMARSDFQGQGYLANSNIQDHPPLSRTDFQGQPNSSYIQGQSSRRNVQEPEQFAGMYRQVQGQPSAADIQGQGQLGARSMQGQGQTNQQYRELQLRQQEQQQQRAQEVNVPAESNYENEAKTQSIACDICGDNHAVVICAVCDNKQLCRDCDIKWHNHPKRQNHKLEFINPSMANSQQNTRQTEQSKQNDVHRMQGVPKHLYKTQQEPAKLTGYSLQSQQQEPARQAGYTQQSHQQEPASQTGYSLQSQQQEPARQTGYSLQSNLGQQQMPQGTQRSPNMEVLQSQYNLKGNEYNTMGQSSNIALPNQAQSEHMNSHMPNSYIYPQSGMIGTMQYPVSSGMFPHGQPVSYVSPHHVAQYPVGYLPNVYMQHQPMPMQQGYLSPVATAGSDMNQRAEGSRAPELPRASSTQSLSSAPVLVQNVRHSISSPRVCEPSDTSNASLSSVSSTSSVSDLLPGIKAINDLERRHSKLQISIMTLNDDLKDWQERIDAIILQNQNFFQDEEYKNLNRKKRKHLQELQELRKYEGELEQFRAEKLQRIETAEKERTKNEVDTLKKRFHQIKMGKDNQPGESPTDMYITPVSVTTSSGPINSSGLVPAGPVTTTYRPQQLQKNLTSANEPIASKDDNCPTLQLNSLGDGDELSEDIKKMLVLDQSPHAPAENNYRLTNKDPTHQNVLLPPNVHSAQGINQEGLYKNVTDFKKGSSEPNLQQGFAAQKKQQIKKSQSSDDFPMWECEHCTFLNDSDTKACTMCFKTSDNPKRIDPNRPTGGREYQGGGNLAEICEFCTVFMEPGTKVCGVCGKTQTKYEAIEREQVQNALGNQKALQEAGNQLDNKQSSAGNQSADTKPNAGNQPVGRRTSAGNQTVNDATGSPVAAASVVGKLIDEEQDQVYLEKKAAHERFEKMNKSPGGVANSTMAGSQVGAVGVQEGAVGNTLGVPKGTEYNVEPLKQEIVQEWIVVDKSSPKENKPQQGEITSSPPNRDIERLKKPSSPSSGSSSSYNSAASSLEGMSETKVKVDNQSAVGKATKAPQLSFQEAIEQINLKREQEQMSLDGHEVMLMFKEGERSGYEVTEVQIALVHSLEEKLRPLDWLKTKWPELMDIVVTVATEKGKGMERNDVGDVSSKEAKQALIKYEGDIDKAVEMCVEERKTKFGEINGRGQYAREDILTALYQNHGNMEEALDQLNHSVVQSFADRLWDTNQDRGGDVAIAAAARSSEHGNSFSNSVTNHNEFQRLVSDKTIDWERRVRMVFVEGKLKSWGRAETVVIILDKDVTVSEDPLECTLEDIIEAVRNCGDRKSSIKYLTQECGICYSSYPMSKIRNLGACDCKLCMSCVKQNFELAIRERYVRNWCCPICDSPGLEDETEASSYFEFLSLMLKNLVSKEVMDLFEVKLRDWHLQKDPNFRWCAHCASGFIWDRPDILGMACPSCRKKTCFMCKIKWEEQHEGLTCEEYEQWKIDNDPEKQAKGVKLYLEENGIDCPSCKMRYSLAKGGCMHFKCPQCGYEFCSGCSQAFLHQEACKLLKSCKGKGLHCHHPRDCFYYLRDSDTDDLQKLLKGHKVRINTDVPPTQTDRDHCPVMEQKEYGPQKKDEPCGKDTKDGMAGLCEDHYKEYLVSMINKNKIDPLAMMNLQQMKILIERNEKHVPKPNQNETEKAYKQRVSQFIKERWQLNR